jgi:parallel beta-helix repeat protein
MPKLDARRYLAFLAMTVLLALAPAGGGVSGAHGGHIACGDILGPGGSFVLDSNVGPCPAPTAALTVIGPAQLDLNGFTVSCVDSFQGPDGIVVGGNGATVVNGTVTNCFGGVIVAGSGGHRIRGLTADANGGGFKIQSSNNRFQNNVVHNHRAAGFLIYGAGTQVRFNILTNNQANSNGLGIYLTTDAHFTVVFRNTAIGNSPTDLRDDNPGCDGNIWLGNTFVTSSQACLLRRAARGPRGQRRGRTSTAKRSRILSTSPRERGRNSGASP